MGFTLSPRGTHSPQMGTANHTIVFTEDYIELLGVLSETDLNEPTRTFLRRREGIERTAFATDDVAAGVAELNSRGIEAIGPLHFCRPVERPDGRKRTAKFAIFLWPQAPAGMEIFARQHLTPDVVWIPELQQHANGALGLVRVEIVSAAPKRAAEHLSRLIDQPVSSAGDAWRVHSGADRAAFLFYDQAGLARRYPETMRAGATEEGPVALAIATGSIEAAAAALGSTAVAHAEAVSAPAAAANGVIVTFVPKGSTDAARLSRLNA